MGTGSHTVQVTETYVYAGRDGRVSQRDTAVTVNGGAAESFTQSFAWNPLGLDSSVSYPLCTHAGCQDAPAVFSDVPAGHPARREIEAIYEQGVTAGCLTNPLRYCPDGSVTRREMAVFLLRAIAGQAYQPPACVTPSFSDVPCSDWGAPWIEELYRRGITAPYDGAGNVTRIGSSWFTYDKVSRLRNANLFLGQTGGGTQVQQSYTLDPFGNITVISGTSGRNTPTSPSTNRLTGGGVNYDAAGNLTVWNGALYDYDRFNQMTRMRSGSEELIYLYTAGDERIWTYDFPKNQSRWTLRDLGGKVLREYYNDGNWTVDSDYVHRDGQLLAAETRHGRRHYHLDHLGTPRLITNGVGYPVAYHVYYPFGEEATAFNQDRERMKFTGHERDLASSAGAGDDLDYMHARHCSPVTGRFLSVDPALESADPFRPQSWNRYNYVRNNPLIYVDPTGEILILSGSKQDLEKLRRLVNSSLNGYQLMINKNGTATLVPVKTQGSASPEQQALASAFSTAINRSEVVRIGVVSGAPDVQIGQYISGRIDVQDITAIGTGPGLSSTSALALEIVEQTAKQVFGLPNTVAGHDSAHAMGVAAQNAVSGFSRGPTNSQNFDPRTGTGTLVTTHTRGKQTVTVTLIWVNGNLVKVKRN